MATRNGDINYVMKTLVISCLYDNINILSYSRPSCYSWPWLCHACYETRESTINVQWESLNQMDSNYTLSRSENDCLEGVRSAWRLGSKWQRLLLLARQREQLLNEWTREREWKQRVELIKHINLHLSARKMYRSICHSWKLSSIMLELKCDDRRWKI